MTLGFEGVTALGDVIARLLRDHLLLDPTGSSTTLYSSTSDRTRACLLLVDLFLASYWLMRLETVRRLLCVASPFWVILQARTFALPF